MFWICKWILWFLSLFVDLNNFFFFFESKSFLKRPNTLGSRNRDSKLSITDFINRQTDLYFSSEHFPRLFDVTLVNFQLKTRRGIDATLARKWRKRFSADEVLARLPSTVRKLRLVNCNATDYGVGQMSPAVRDKITSFTIRLCSQIRVKVCIETESNLLFWDLIICFQIFTQLTWPNLTELIIDDSKQRNLKTILQSASPSLKRVFVRNITREKLQIYRDEFKDKNFSVKFDALIFFVDVYMFLF